MMTKKITIGFLVLMIALMLTLSCGAAGNVSDQLIVIGQNGIYDLNSAFNALNNNAGNAVIYLNGPLTLNQQAELPANLSGIKSVTLASYSGSPVSVAMGGSVICANGVPLIIDQNVNLSNGFLIGGKCLAQNGNASVEDSALIINGSADYVIGGGLAMEKGAVSNVKNVNIIINGSVNTVHGGGYAINGGTADVTEYANLVLTPTGKITNVLYAGGYAGGSGSRAMVSGAHVLALGNAGNVNKNSGYSVNGGTAGVGSGSNNSGVISIKNPDEPIIIQNPTAVPQPQQPYNWQGAAGTVIYIGPGQQARNFSDAVNQLPYNSGNVEFRLMGDFKQDSDVIIPGNRGIYSLKLTGNNNSRMTVTWPEDIGFFANGIPTEIDSSVVFNGGILYGGANVVGGQHSVLQQTSLIIRGKVNTVVAGSKAKGAGAEAHVMNTNLVFHGKATGWLYGGGSALYGGHSVVDGTTSMYIMPGAYMEFSIAGGGYAFGENAVSEVKDSLMDVSGTVEYAVYLGGYADQRSLSQTTGQSYLNLQPQGKVGQSVWYGGRAYNGARATLDTASAQITGHVGAYVHKNGNNSNGGTVSTRVIK